MTAEQADAAEGGAGAAGAAGATGAGGGWARAALAGLAPGVAYRVTVAAHAHDLASDLFTMDTRTSTTLLLTLLLNSSSLDSFIL